MTQFLNTANRAESTLASNITIDALSLTVATGGGARFPTSNFHFSIGDEIILCSTRTGDVFTLGGRGREGTTPAAHLAGARVELNLTSEIIRQLQTEKLNRRISVLVRNSNYTPTPEDDYISVDASVSPVIITLPTVIGVSGRIYTFKRIDDSGNRVRVIGTGGQTIDREPHMDILFQDTSFGVVSDGANWQII